MTKVILVVLALFQAACTVVPQRNELQSFSYGEPPSGEAVIYFVRNARGFFDPMSALIACAEPYKGWAVANGQFKPTIGWITYCEYNAKNRFGAYTGVQGMHVVSIYNTHQFVFSHYGRY